MEKAYVVAYVAGGYWVPAYKKFYKTEKAAKKRCDQLNKQHNSTNHVVLCADNWHKVGD